jgi:hypothetical protein
MTPNHIGILKDIARKGFYKLEECGEWMKDQLVEIIMSDGPCLIHINESYIVTLTSEGYLWLKEMGFTLSTPAPLKSTRSTGPVQAGF